MDIYEYVSIVPVINENNESHFVSNDLVERRQIGLPDGRFLSTGPLKINDSFSLLSITELNYKGKRQKDYDLGLKTIYVRIGRDVISFPVNDELPSKFDLLNDSNGGIYKLTFSHKFYLMASTRTYKNEKPKIAEYIQIEDYFDNRIMIPLLISIDGTISLETGMLTTELREASYLSEEFYMAKGKALLRDTEVLGCDFTLLRTLY